MINSIGLGIRAAGIEVASFIEGSRVLAVDRIFYDHPAQRGEGNAIPGIAGGQAAVDHIHLPPAHLKDRDSRCYLAKVVTYHRVSKNGIYDSHIFPWDVWREIFSYLRSEKDELWEIGRAHV